MRAHSDGMSAHSSEMSAHSSEMSAHSSEMSAHLDGMSAHSSEMRAHSGGMSAHSSEMRAHSGGMSAHLAYLFPLARLWVLQSIWQFLASVAPPFDHAATCSASISANFQIFFWLALNSLSINTLITTIRWYFRKRQR